MLTFEQIKELIELVRDSQLEGVEIERSGFRLKVDGRRPPEEGFSTSGRAQEPLLVPVSHAADEIGIDQAPQLPVAENRSPEPEIEGYQLKSPIVGTFYSSPNPDAKPYASVGQVVEKGQVLCIVEAMKLMNEIEADVTGEVLEIYPKNAQPVEFGEPLFLIRSSK